MFRLGPPKQIAYAVPDAFEAAKKWVEDFGAGPFFISEHIPVTEVLYRGTPATFDHTSAYGQWGDIMVELVQDHGTGPSVVRDLFGPRWSGPRISHIHKNSICHLRSSRLSKNSG